MKITSEVSILDFNAWSGGKYTQDKIIQENKIEEFDQLIEELYPEGIDATNLNDLLWFEENWIYENLGIEIEE